MLTKVDGVQFITIHIFGDIDYPLRVFVSASLITNDDKVVFHHHKDENLNPSSETLG